MSGRSTKRVKNSSEKTLQNLEKEAEEFTKKVRKKPLKPSTGDTEKPLPQRDHLAGLILAGLLARSQGLVSQNDLIREAYDWADRMLEN